MMAIQGIASVFGRVASSGMFTKTTSFSEMGKATTKTTLSRSGAAGLIGAGWLAEKGFKHERKNANREK